MRHTLFVFLFLLFAFVTTAAAQTGTLVIETDPPDALVRIMNIRPPYEDGITLKEGPYKIEVSKPGLPTVAQTIQVQADKVNRFRISLQEETVAAKDTGRLFVATDPPAANVMVMNIRPAFEQGMALKPGAYELKIEKPGYETVETTVQLKAGQDNTFSYTLQQSDAAQAEAPPAGAGTLTVKTTPPDATVRIMNIRPKYEDGIVLKPGDYPLEISHSGHETKAITVTVQAGETKTVEVDLRDPDAATPPASATTTAPAVENAEAPFPEGHPQIARVVVTEDFADNARGWYEVGANDISIGVNEGVYRIQHKRPTQGWIAWNAVGMDPERDFALETRMVKRDGVLDYGYGVIWGVTEGGGAYHSFRVSGNGLYSYGYENDGEWRTVIDWTPSPAIVPGNNVKNTLMVVRQGERLHLYINGAQVDDIAYIPVEGSMVGFKVDNQQTVEVESLLYGLPL